MVSEQKKKKKEVGNRLGLVTRKTNSLRNPSYQTYVLNKK
jgi:hypothetical protein